jgi:hypothetical protein
MMIKLCCVFLPPSDYEEEEVEETLDDIIHLAEGDDGEEDPGHDLFEHYPESEEEDEQEEEYDDKERADGDATIPYLTKQTLSSLEGLSPNSRKLLSNVFNTSVKRSHMK